MIFPNNTYIHCAVLVPLYLCLYLYLYLYLLAVACCPYKRIKLEEEQGGGGGGGERREEERGEERGNAVKQKHTCLKTLSDYHIGIQNKNENSKRNSTLEQHPRKQRKNTLQCLTRNIKTLV